MLICAQQVPVARAALLNTVGEQLSDNNTPWATSRTSILKHVPGTNTPYNSMIVEDKDDLMATSLDPDVMRIRKFREILTFDESMVLPVYLVAYQYKDEYGDPVEYLRGAAT